MNFTETFSEFSSRLTTTDLMLYAGAALVLFVLFKDKVGFVKTNLLGLVNKIQLPKTKETKESKEPTVTASNDQDVFLNLVSSWKQTRDLALLAGCEKAVEAADQMFPHLSPVTCKGRKDESVKE